MKQSNLQVPVCLGIKDGVILRFAQLGQPQQMAVCLVEQDGRSSVLSLSLSLAKERERRDEGNKVV